MRKVEIARRLAFAARAAERAGKHRSAAELYAAALRVLQEKSSHIEHIEEVAASSLCPEPPGDDETDSSSASDEETASSSARPRHTLIRRTQQGEAARSSSGVESEPPSAPAVDVRKR